MSLLNLFCHVDEFCRQVVPAWMYLQLTSGTIRRQRSKQLSVNEIMTILIWFHCSHYRTFKAYYTEAVRRHLRAVYPDNTKRFQAELVERLAHDRVNRSARRLRDRLKSDRVPSLQI